MPPGHGHYFSDAPDELIRKRSSGERERALVTDASLTTTATPKVYYSFNETSGATATDTSGNSNNGTLVNGPIFTPGRYGNAVQLDGANDYVQLTNSQAVNLGTASFTILAWVKRGDVGTEYSIVTKTASNSWVAKGKEFFLGGPGDGNKVGFGEYNRRYLLSNTAINDLNWHHVAVTLSRPSQAAVIYIDGAQSGSGTLNLTSDVATHLLRIGRNGNSGFLRGHVDEFKIYDVVLPVEDIVAEMNNQQAPGPDVTPPTVTNAAPPANATGVATTAMVSVTFGEAMNAATINSSTVQLLDAQGQNVSGAVAYIGGSRTATFSPTGPLDAASSYRILVRGGASGAKDVAGNALSLDFTSTFTTAAAPDTTPPVLSQIAAQNPTAGGATIVWTSNEPATSQVQYGQTSAYGAATTLVGTLATSHSVVLSGLIPSTMYHYRVLSRDGSGNESASGDFTFTTGAPPPSGQSFYVAPDGIDTNPGSIAQPFRTIERARAAVRAVNAAMASDIVVYLRQGEHVLANMVTFDQLDSGTNGFYVVYRNYPGETPIVSGGERISSSWTAVGGGTFRTNVGSLRFRDLYVNSGRATRARTPNAGSYHQLQSWDTGQRTIAVNATETSAWQNLAAVEMVILGKGVNQSNLRIASITGSGSSRSITPREPERTRIFQQVYPPKESRPYYLENALEFLDSSGEWYLDSTNGDLFYRPRAGEDLATAVVMAPRLETLMRVQGTLSSPIHHLKFFGLTFAHTAWMTPSNEGYVGDQASIAFIAPLPGDQITSYPGWRLPAAVHVEAADQNVFERNVWKHLGASAVNFYSATHDNSFIGNLITDVAGSGISVDVNLEGNPADARKICRRDIIRNNYITKTGRSYFQTVAIMAGYTDGIIIEHNEVSETPYTGITVGWGWANVDNAARNNLIRYNNVTNTNNLMSDGAGIYTLSKQSGTQIRENYVHDIVRPAVAGGFTIGGIYLDEGSNLITVADNVIQRAADTSIFQNANGPGNTFSNNAGTSPTTIANAGLEPAYQDIRPAAPPPPPETVVHLPFDDANGTVAHDASGSGHDGAIFGGAIFGVGRFAGAIDLDGVNDHVQVDQPGLPTGDFTWSIWVNPTALSAFQGVIEAQGLSVAELELNLEQGRVSVWLSGASALTSTGTVPAGAWTHIVLRRLGSSLRLFLNGVADPASATSTTSLNFTSCPLLIGVDADAGCTGALNGFFRGRIDDVRIFSRALSDAEISALGAP